MSDYTYKLSVSIDLERSNGQLMATVVIGGVESEYFEDPTTGDWVTTRGSSSTRQTDNLVTNIFGYAAADNLISYLLGYAASDFDHAPVPHSEYGDNLADTCSQCGLAVTSDGKRHGDDFIVG